MTQPCRSDGCLGTAEFHVTNEATDDRIPVCKDCLEELLSRPGHYQIDQL